MNARVWAEGQRARLIEDNMRLVHAVARRFAGRGAEHDELVQAGCVGLIQAVDRFDPARGAQFSTYAVPLIMGEIRAHLRTGGAVHISRTIRERAAQAALIAERVRAEQGREPRIDDIAREMGVSAQEAALALDSRIPPASLDAQGPSALDTLKDSAEPINTLALKEAMGSLDERARRVMALRYFRDYSQAETARALGISQPQVSRIEKRALDRLKAYLI